jgi:2-C-methyl-D-erythritol 4-phosphate cytidylyltransferase
VPSPRDVGVIIVAAGQGTRIGGSTPKQFLEVAGIPMLLRSIRPFARHPSVAHVTVVLAPSDVAAPPGWFLPQLGSMLSLVAGGAGRSDSVAAGLATLPAACRVVLVHDAARPFVDTLLIDRIIDVARGGDAVVPALAVTDTIKEMDATDPTRIARTVPRDRLRRVQTPQGFPREMLVEAHAAARREGWSATDDAALVEQAGGTVRIVDGSPRNLKVTTAEDLEFAEYLATRVG